MVRRWEISPTNKEANMFSKQTVTLRAEGGIELAAWLFLPEQRAQPLPAITMAHGYAATRYHGIERLAEALATAGFAVLLHDHRGFGDSGGEPRQDQACLCDMPL